MMKLLRLYFRTSLILRIFAGFILGSLIGGALWGISLATKQPIAVNLAAYISPFGTVFVPLFSYAFSGWMIGWASTPLDPRWADRWAMFFGDLNDSESEISRVLREKFTIQRKPSLGTHPSVFYII